MENREKAVLVREDPGPVKIGTLCSDCTNPEEKVMQSYVFDLGNIIRLGMYEKARMSAEVLCEQGGDPVEIARETVFPAVREVLDRYEKGEVNKAHAVKSLEAAEVAENVFRRERKDWDEAALRPGAAVVAAAGEKVSWERKLLETSLECCGFRAERMEPLSAAFGGTSPQGGEARMSCEQSDPGSPLGESCPRSGLRGGEAKVVFVEVTPEAFSQTRDWLEIFRREHPVSSVILFGKYEKLIDRLKIDSDLYCKDPVFGGKIIGEYFLNPENRRSIMRPDWDHYFMEVANVVKTRSTCIRRQVGAIIVKDHRVISTGYNGAASGAPHCQDVGCLREKLGVKSGERHELCVAIHAEQNAIVQAAKYGTPIEGATLYCTCQPCAICAKMIVNAGIVRVVFSGPYPDPLAEKILKEGNIEICEI